MPALATTAWCCILRVASVTTCWAASRGNATLPMAATSGIGSIVSDTAIAYLPRSAAATVCESTSWSSCAFSVAGVSAAICAMPYAARGANNETRARPGASELRRQYQ